MLQDGPTPRIDLDDWQFTISNEVGEKYTWSWRELLSLPSERPTVDIHCTPTDAWLDLRGARSVRIPLTPPAHE